MVVRSAYKRAVTRSDQIDEKKVCVVLGVVGVRWGGRVGGV